MDRGAWWSTVQGVAKSQTGVKVKTKRCGRTNLLLRELGKNSYFCGWHKMTGKPFGKMFKKSLKMLFWPAMCHTEFSSRKTLRKGMKMLRDFLPALCAKLKCSNNLQGRHRGVGQVKEGQRRTQCVFSGEEQVADQRRPRRTLSTGGWEKAGCESASTSTRT